MTDLPTYICHKRVKALEIRSIGHYTHDANDRLTREVMFADPSFKPIWVSGDLFARYTPMPGDYYVVYEDGYASFSPRKAFLEGYTIVSDDNVLMERLNDLAATERGQMVIPEWLRGFDAQDRVQRVAREAYVTINSLKQQIERLKADVTVTRQMAGFKEVKSEKADPDQA